MILDDLYMILELGENEASIKLSDENHSVFKAHFPSKPILPGYCHFEIVSKVFNIDITSIKKAKFTAIVLPSQILVYKRNSNRFKVLHEEKEIASFSL